MNRQKYHSNAVPLQKKKKADELVKAVRIFFFFFFCKTLLSSKNLQPGESLIRKEAVALQ